MIKNIVFDMGNVLLKYSPQEYIRTAIDDQVIAEAVLKELFYGREWLELDEGTITEEAAVKQVSMRIPDYAEHVQKAMDNWHSDLTPIDGMEEMVKGLKNRGYGIYLLSNTSIRFFQYQKDVKMFKSFDGFIISSQEKMVKPNKEIFDCICQRFELNPCECIFIDDLEANISGAVSAGFQAHLFQGAQELSEHLKQIGVL